MQGMKALLDLLYAVDGSVSEAAKLLGYVMYGLVSFFYMHSCLSYVQNK